MWFGICWFRKSSINFFFFLFSIQCWVCVFKFGIHFFLFIGNAFYCWFKNHSCYYSIGINSRALIALSHNRNMKKPKIHATISWKRSLKIGRIGRILLSFMCILFETSDYIMSYRSYSTFNVWVIRTYLSKMCLHTNTHTHIHSVNLSKHIIQRIEYDQKVNIQHTNIGFYRYLSRFIFFVIPYNVNQTTFYLHESDWKAFAYAVSWFMS